MEYISKIFDPKPSGTGAWALRSDPYLYDDVKDYFSKIPFPISEDEFKVEFERCFLLLTGYSIYTEEILTVKKYVFEQRGISNGGISSEYWRMKQLPMLLSRLRAYNSKSERAKYVSQLFDPQPDSEAWGFRGDIFLYDDMMKAFSQTPLPISEDDFKKEFERRFLSFTGHSIFVNDYRIELKKYKSKNGSNPNNFVSPESWRGKILSILLERLREYNSKSVYPPKIINQFPESFNSNWSKF